MTGAAEDGHSLPIRNLCMPIMLPVAIPAIRALRTHGFLKILEPPSFTHFSWSDHEPEEAMISLTRRKCRPSLGGSNDRNFKGNLAIAYPLRRTHFGENARRVVNFLHVTSNGKSYFWTSLSTMGFTFF